MPPQATPEIDAAVQLALDRKRIADLEEQLRELKADRDKFLRWGVIVLGGAVVSLASWIFNLIAKP